MDTISLLGSMMGLGFVSGLNLYASVLTLGLGIRFELIHPHPAISNLEVLGNPYVLAAAGALYLVEFLADKIPWVDSVWDTIHSVIRPLGAAAIGATAVGSVDATTKMVVILVSGSVALSSHSSKAGTRVAVNHSPEPFSNIVLSLLEDGLAVVGAWLAVAHPILMLVIVAIFLAFFAWLSPRIFRLVRVEMIAVFSLAKKLWSKRVYLLRASEGSPFRVSVRGAPASNSTNLFVEGMPERHAEYWESNFRLTKPHFCLRCVAGKGVKGLRNSVGYLHHIDAGLVFITRRFFRFRTHRVDLNDIKDVRLKKGLLVDPVSWRTDSRQQTFVFFKHRLNHAEEVVKTLQKSGAVRL